MIMCVCVCEGEGEGVCYAELVYSTTSYIQQNTTIHVKGEPEHMHS